MKKQELIHLHGLLADVRKQYNLWDEDVDLEAYEELGVKPTSIHKSKTDHKEAVLKLVEGITGDEIDLEEELELGRRDEVYQVLRENAQLTQNSEDPVVQLTEDVAVAINEVIGRYDHFLEELSRLDGKGWIDSDEDNYDIGTDLYLKV